MDLMRFEVSRVRRGTTRLETGNVGDAVHRLTTTETLEQQPGGSWVSRTAPTPPIEGHGSRTDLLVATPYHPLVAAASAAFEGHYPLVLGPDEVWLVLAQGFATHVRQNADLLQERFVSHDGRLRLDVQRDDFRRSARGGEPPPKCGPSARDEDMAQNPWPEAIAAFADAIRAHVGKRHDLVVADFSTTGPIERTTSQLVLMDAMQSYFEYHFHTLCGIPEITLLGTPDDWRRLRDRVRALREFELAWWIDPLEPIVDQLVATAEQKVDRTFWGSFFKLKDESGGPYISGWINLLFPYLRRQGELQPSPFLDGWESALDQQFAVGPTTDGFPSALSRAPFTWHYFDDELAMELLGGFLGFSQDEQTLALRPELGWAVRAVAQGGR